MPAHAALKLASSGEPVVIGEQFSRTEMERMSARLKELGATAELYVTSGPDHFW